MRRDGNGNGRSRRRPDSKRRQTDAQNSHPLIPRHEGSAPGQLSGVTRADLRAHLTCRGNYLHLGRTRHRFLSRSSRRIGKLVRSRCVQKSNSIRASI
jgi:hypothetical protein